MKGRGMSDGLKATGTVILALLLVALLCIGGWFLYWWAHRESVNREASIRRDSFEVQQTYREQVLQRADEVADIDAQLTAPDITDEQRAALQAQREATRRRGCDQVQRLAGQLPPDVEDFALTECGGR